MTATKATRVGSVVTIEGDRRSGKTETLIRIAIADAILGRRVLYGTYLCAVANETFHRLDNQIPLDWVQRMRRVAGNQRIELINGGLIQMVTVTTTGHRGIDVDTVILDDAHMYEDHVTSAIVCTAAAAEPHVYIARVTDTGE